MSHATVEKILRLVIAIASAILGAIGGGAAVSAGLVLM